MQLALRFPSRAVSLPEMPGEPQWARVESLAQEPIAEIVWTHNRSRMLSVRRTAAGLVVRAHQCFAAAPLALDTALATLLKGRQGTERRHAVAAVRRYFERHGPPPSSRLAPRKLRCQPVGCTLDLRDLRDEINQRYHRGCLEVSITWGRHAAAPGRGRRRRSIRLGSYDARVRLIRIHPQLDQTWVPTYVVAYVVHHEMLHAAIPPLERGNRRVLHGAELRRREREFPDLARATRWIDEHLERLLDGRAPSPCVGVLGYRARQGG